MSQSGFSQGVPSLVRADKLIGKGSFAAARAELQKLLGVLSEAEAKVQAQQKLQQCDLELRKQEAKEWVKRGRKSEKRGKLADALAAFRQAQVRAEEPWMAQRIADLQATLERHGLAERARAAEKAGDWQTASGLYAAAGAEEASQESLLRRARELLEAGDYATAAGLYASSATRSQRDLYDWGYCSYMLGQLAACLKAWDKLSLSSPELAQQRDAVQRLLHDQVLSEFSSAAEPSLVLQPLAAYLNEVRPTEKTQAILDFYFLRSIEAYWRGKQLLTLLSVLDDEAALVSTKIHQHPRLVEVYAKTGFKLAEASAEHLPLFSLYYLTAVYRKRFSSRNTENARPDEIRAVLIQLGDEVVSRYQDSDDSAARRQLGLWQLEKEIMAELSSILPKNRLAVSEAICTPQFAWRFGCGSSVLTLLEANRHRARDLKSLLALGAYFTPYGPSLYSIRLVGEESDADSSRPTAEPENEFERFARNKLCFADGPRAIRAKRKPPRRFFQAALELFSVDGEDESRFLALALEEKDPERVDQYIEMLKQLCRARCAQPQADASKVLSRLMSTRASDQFSNGEISVKVFRNIMEKALEWDPHNEGARGALEDARLEQELEDLDRAFGRHKYERLCQLACDSDFEEVHDTFWKRLTWAAAQVPNLDPDCRSVELWELKRCALTVDPAHPLLREIDRLLGVYGPSSGNKGNSDHEPL